MFTNYNLRIWLNLEYYSLPIWLNLEFFVYKNKAPFLKILIPFKPRLALASVALLAGAPFGAPEGYQFDPRSGHIPRLWV